MTTQKLRKTSNKSEIVNLITTSSEETKSTAWQIVDGKRVIYSVMGFHLIPSERKGVLHGLFDTTIPDKNLPLNIALDNLSKSFQVTITKIQQNEIEVTMPTELVTTEFRSGERIYLPHSEHYSAILSAQSSNSNKSTQMFKVMLRDLSVRGLGIIIPQGTFINTKGNDDVTLLQLGEIELLAPITGKTVHISEQLKTIGSIAVTTKKIGIELDSEIPEKTIKQLIAEVSQKIKNENDSSGLI